MDDISHNCIEHNYGIIIKDVCVYRDACDPHVLTATEIVQLIEYLYDIRIFVVMCTWFISILFYTVLLWFWDTWLFFICFVLV